jgi:hypothetical protein
MSELWAKNRIADSMARYRESEFMATAADDTTTETNFVRSMRPVALDMDRDKEFEGFFFPKGEATPDGYTAREFLLPVLESLSDVTSNINLFYAFMRQCMNNANHISGMSQEDAQTYIDMYFHDTFRMKRAESSTKTIVQNFLIAIRASSSSFHNIYRSARYADGVDIVMNGTGDDVRGRDVPPVFFGSMDADLHGPSFLNNGGRHEWAVDRERRGKWQSTFGLNLVAAAKDISVFLFGTSAISDRTLHKSLSLSTEFTKIEEIFTRHTGFKLPKEMITDLNITNHLAEQFLQVEMLKVPSGMAKNVAARVRAGNIRKPSDFTGEVGRSSMHEANTLVEHRMNSDDEFISPEAEALNVCLRSTIRFTLEKDIANYVSQSEEHERPSLSRINAWFSLYIGQVLRARATAKRKGQPKSRNASTISMNDIPRYAMGATTLKKLSDIRASNGFVVEKTKGNSEDMYVTPSGTLSVRPSVDAFKASTQAEDYEKLSDEILEILNRYDIPMAAFQSNPRADAWPHINAVDIEKLWELLQELKSYDGALIGYDWDYGVQIYASSTPGILTTSLENGAVTPDALTIADQLGYNMAKEGQQPMKRSFASTMYTLTYAHPVGQVKRESERMYGADADAGAAAFAKSNIVKEIVNLYLKLAYNDNKAPKMDVLAKNAMRALGLEKLPTEKGHDYSSLYLRYFTPEGDMKRETTTSIRALPVELLADAMTQASGGPGSQLWHDTYEQMATGDKLPKSYEVAEELENHPNFFNTSTSTTAEFTKLYSYFGGQFFKQILDAINSIPASDYLNERKSKVSVEVGANPYRDDGIPLVLELTTPSNTTIMKDILPYTLMLGKYAVNHETIFAEADEQVESLQPDTGFTADDLKIPGMVADDRAIFPHQESVQASLRKPIPPAFAILALDPGGGKTGQGVIDMTCMVRDMSSVGNVVRPLVICPNGLITQWCEDIKYFLGANWNAFPLSADVMKRWGQDKLLAYAAKAPANTIFIASMTFIQGRNVKLTIGNAQIDVPMNLEFVRRLGCSYVAIDESHNLKNFTSSRHKAVKALTTATTVKWIRLLTGTIMPDRARDIEGQIALHSPAVFRSGEIAMIKSDADVGEEDVIIDGKAVATYTPLNAKRAVDKLSHYAAFIVKKRKEWAFMLPAPIERFLAIGMVDTDEGSMTSELEREQQKLHAQLYETVLKKTLEDVKKLQAQKNKVSAGEDEEEDNGGGESNPDNDVDFAGEKIDQLTWETSIARLERLIIAPQFDEDFQSVFGDAGANFKSRKAKYIANLVDDHFHPAAWRRGQSYKEYNLVAHGDKLYVARKWNAQVADHVALPPEVQNIAPPDAPEYWKEEPRGKCIVITRYNYSARAVYEALPAEYQRQAVIFTGDEPNKHEGFNRFKTDNKIQILIANEQGMSEGHNLQLASRIIRAESPWGPGALSQTNARIFRPDPKGAMAAANGSGEMTRDVVFLDWVLANNTMEVPKLARVISKTFGIVRFTEADNPRYKGVLSQYIVPTEKENPELSLGVEMLANIKGLQDSPFKEMVGSDTEVGAYQALNKVENQEFREMRQTQRAVMLPIQADANVPGAERMEVLPFVPNQPIPDPKGWEPVVVAHVLRDEKIASNYDEELFGKPVMTEFGLGRIVNFTTKKGSGGKVLSSIKVRIKNPPADFDEWQTIDATLVHLVTGEIKREDLPLFDVPLDRTPTDAKRSDRQAEREQKQREAQEAEEEKERQIRERQAAKTIRIVKKQDADGQKRRENEAKGRPLNEGVYTIDQGTPLPTAITKAVIPEGGDPTVGVIVEGDNTVNVYPAYYHGFATLEAEFDETAVNLKKLGFKHTPPYAFVVVSNKKKFHAIYEYLHNNFDLRDKTVSMIEEINNAFEPGRKNVHNLWYKLELAPVTSLPGFFNTSKRIVENRREVRVFPVFMEDQVMLCIDLRTNPAILKHIGKAIPGAGTKWQKSDGHWFYFGKGKTDLRDMIAKIKRNGYDVVNAKEALKELTELRFKFRKD